MVYPVGPVWMVLAVALKMVFVARARAGRCATDRLQFHPQRTQTSPNNNPTTNTTTSCDHITNLVKPAIRASLHFPDSHRPVRPHRNHERSH